LTVVGNGELGVGADMEVIDWVRDRIYLGPVIGGREIGKEVFDLAVAHFSRAHFSAVLSRKRERGLII
jgi:hypothetical protein